MVRHELALGSSIGISLRVLGFRRAEAIFVYEEGDLATAMLLIAAVRGRPGCVVTTIQVSDEQSCEVFYAKVHLNSLYGRIPCAWGDAFLTLPEDESFLPSLAFSRNW